MLSNRASASDLLKICAQDGGGLEGFKKLVHHQLTAIILQDLVLMQFTNCWSFKTYIPELGLQASLITNHVEDWFTNWVNHDHHLHLNDSPTPSIASGLPSLQDHDPVGLRVPFYIAYINQEDHLILKLDPNCQIPADWPATFCLARIKYIIPADQTAILPELDNQHPTDQSELLS
ncbi:hypothetical protein PGT21_011709 [Puccinia graminis f. sp. tritici]|uniref:Uncharacterized protein n=1 Tax=Puccinia graminis f. sp. tritici TaxID=56615 RepID=A0A5B0NHJ4_PUCGR|nr:hypothetical protein PGT21_011709 [Puccinia graminis f. sp. tritici]KAA1088076.1 hypothetical protein PGTUg99_027524 [Puccinia graminis f. sp. tritici]